MRLGQNLLVLIKKKACTITRCPAGSHKICGQRVHLTPHSPSCHAGPSCTKPGQLYPADIAQSGLRTRLLAPISSTGYRGLSVGLKVIQALYSRAQKINFIL